MIIDFMLFFLYSVITLLLLELYLISFKDEKTNPSRLSVCAILIFSVINAFLSTQYGMELVWMWFSAILLACLIKASLIYRVAMLLSFIAIERGIQRQVQMFYAVMENHFPEWKTVSSTTKHFFILLIFSVIIISLCFGFGSRKVRLKILSKRVAIALTIYSGILFLISLMVMKMVKGSEREADKIFVILIIGLLILCFYIELYLMQYITEYIARLYREKTEKVELRRTAHHYEELESVYGNIKEIKHNLKNRLLEFEHLVEAKDIDGLLEQLHASYEEISNIDSEIYSVNPAVNSILRAKIGLAKTRGISVDVNVTIPSNIRLKDGYFGVIFGDLLDNAIEACALVEKERRYITVGAKVEGDTLSIKMENSKSNEQTNISIHRKGRGIGQVSIARIFTECGGYIGFQDEGNSYIACGVLDLSQCKLEENA